MAVVLKTLLERFESKYIPEPNSGCWLWFGAAQKDGRGTLAKSPKGNIVAPRVSWQLFRGEIPDGLDVLHTCDVPACVNPDHLWVGTHKENMHDCIRKGRFVLSNARGERMGKLTNAQVMEIRSRKLKNKEYAVKFGIRADHVSVIQSGRLWSHLPVIPKPEILRTPEEWIVSDKKAAYYKEWRRLKKLKTA